MAPKGLLSFFVPLSLVATAIHQLRLCSAYILQTSSSLWSPPTLLLRSGHLNLPVTGPSCMPIRRTTATFSQTHAIATDAGHSRYAGLGATGFSCDTRTWSSRGRFSHSRHRKRPLLQQMSMVGTSEDMSHAASVGAKSVNWPLWYVLPIAPYQTRKTVMKEIVPGKMWTFDQLQGILYVIVPVRMTVIKLENTPGGGLFVYAPVAPTGECMAMIRKLEAEHGPVRHIILGTLGLEHKVFAGPFAQRFSEAKVWFTPGQYSFPVGLPLSWLGFGGRPTKQIPASTEDAPWSADLEHAVLGPFFSKDGSGGYGETAFYHKATRTLLVTDMVVKVEDEVPEIVEQDPRPLLFHARDNALERVENTPIVRLKGWRRIVQFALTFQPSSLEVVDIKKALLEDAPRSKMKELGWGGLFPFEWKGPREDERSFRALKGGLLVAPILQVLLLNRDPGPVLDWADRVSKWPFRRVIPCHLANDVATNPVEFRKAFRFLEKGGPGAGGSNGVATAADGLLSLLRGEAFDGGNGGGAQPLPEDLQFLRDAEKTLVEAGTLFPAAEPIDRRRR